VTPAVFLPGASGRRSYWQPVAQRACPDGASVLPGWPGFDDEPADPLVRCLTDLPDYVLRRVDGVCDLVAQSMGGVVALMLALQRPERIRRLVLCGTSGGIDMSRFEAEEWRLGYRREMPESAPRWFVDDRSDLTDRLPRLAQRTLLLWGEDDRISPPAVGRHLASLLPNASFQTLSGAGHMLAEEKPDEVAASISAYLREK
jgi:pimeloyl-ACP methyl ester carboxylesterase